MKKKILGRLLLCIALIIVIVFSIRGIHPEWARFRRQMMKDYYPGITKIYTITAGPTFIIRFDLKSEPTLKVSKEMFERTREFIYSEQGFAEILKMKKKGDIFDIKVTFDNPQLKDVHIVFQSQCSNKALALPKIPRNGLSKIEEKYGFMTRALALINIQLLLCAYRNIVLS